MKQSGRDVAYATEMYHRTRWLHRWIGVFGALFLAIIAVTGFLLATKGTFGWVRPPETEGEKIAAPSEIVSMERVVDSVFRENLAELRTMKDIDRVDYRPKSNIFKVTSKQGYREVQVDGKSGKVTSVGIRNDQLAEDIHDLSFFADALHAYGLPLVAIFLLFLAISGVGMFFVPVVRRYKFRKKGPRPPNVS